MEERGGTIQSKLMRYTQVPVEQRVYVCGSSEELCQLIFHCLNFFPLVHHYLPPPSTPPPVPLSHCPVFQGLWESPELTGRQWQPGSPEPDPSTSQRTQLGPFPLGSGCPREWALRLPISPSATKQLHRDLSVPWHHTEKETLEFPFHKVP